MERIIKTVSFFLKCQDSKDFSINQRNNILYVSCANKKDAIRNYMTLLGLIIIHITKIY